MKVLPDDAANRSVGSVKGSPAKPQPQTRRIRETTAKLGMVALVVADGPGIRGVVEEGFDFSRT